MSDKEVNVHIEASAVGDVKKPFADLKAGADAADEALLKPRNRLKEIGGELRTTEKGLKNFQGGLFGLAASASLVDERFGKATAAIGGLHSATQLFRGAGMLSGAAGIGGILAPLAAGIAAVGAVALATSPKLQDALGGAMYRMSDAAKEATEQMKRLKTAHDDILTAGSLGVGTLEREGQLRGEMGVRRPFEERQRSLREEQAQWTDRAKALRAFPGTAFDPTHEALANISQTPLDPHNMAAGLAGRTERLRALSAAPFRAPDELQRESSMAKGIEGRADRQVTMAQARAGDFGEREAITKRLGAIHTSRRELQDAKKRLSAEEGRMRDLEDWGLGFTTTDKRSQLQAEVAAREKKQQGLGGEEQRLRSLLGGRNTTTGAEGEDLGQRLQESEDRLRAAKEKTLEIQHRVNMAEADHLKAIQGSAAEQSKLAAQVVREEEARLRGSKIGLGLMSGKDLLHAQSISRRIEAGQNLGEKDLKFARGIDVFKPAIEAQGLRQAENNPIIRDILQRVHAEQQVEQAKAAQTTSLELKADITKKIEAVYKLDNESIASKIDQEIVPGLKKAFEEASTAMAMALEHRAAQLLQQWKKNMEAGAPKP